MVIGLAAAMACAVLFGVAAAIQAIAVRRSGLFSRLMVVVALTYLAGWGLHLVAILRLPLYLAQVSIAGSLAVTALVAARVVKEPLCQRDWWAIAGLVGGLALMVVGAGGVGHREFRAGFTVALYAAVGVVLVVATFAVRSQGPRSGAVLGVLAGVAYSGSPIATRSLSDPHPDLRTLAPAFTIVLFGLMGFWLYSLALRRASITAATAPVVLFETLVPAAAGVLLFGDSVRPGWWLATAAGFAVATAAALLLSDAESRLDEVDVTELPEPIQQVAEVLDPGVTGS